MAAMPDRNRRKAEELLGGTDWMNADRGWMAKMPVEERIGRRQADATEALAYAVLALGGPSGDDVLREMAAKVREVAEAKGWSPWAAAFMDPDVEFDASGMPSTESIVAELRRQDRAAVLREAAEVADGWNSDCQSCAVELEVARELRRMADEAAPTPPAAELTAYRAEYEHEDRPLGQYSTRTAARAHCEAHARRDWPTEPLTWHPDEDEPDAVEVLAAGGAEGDRGDTGYLVRAVELPDEYDEELDDGLLPYEPYEDADDGITADEQAEMDRDIEYRLDAADEARFAELERGADE